VGEEMRGRLLERRERIAEKRTFLNGQRWTRREEGRKREGREDEERRIIAVAYRGRYLGGPNWPAPERAPISVGPLGLLGGGLSLVETKLLLGPWAADARMWKGERVKNLRHSQGRPDYEEIQVPTGPACHSENLGMVRNSSTVLF